MVLRHAHFWGWLILPQYFCYQQLVSDLLSPPVPSQISQLLFSKNDNIIILIFIFLPSQSYIIFGAFSHISKMRIKTTSVWVGRSHAVRRSAVNSLHPPTCPAWLRHSFSPVKSSYGTTCSRHEVKAHPTCWDRFQCNPDLCPWSWPRGVSWWGGSIAC